MKKLLIILPLLLFIIPFINATDIFCNDYEFSCCDLSSVGTYQATETNGFVCNYDKCVITSYWDSKPYARTGYVIGSGSCGWKNSALTINYYDCEVKRGAFYTAGEIMVRGEIAFINPDKEKYDFFNEYPKPSFIIERFSNRVMFCGDSACSASNTGVPISGSQGCAFTTSGNVYSTSRSKLSTQTSYTVPIRSCYLSWNNKRFICGNTEETCSSDTDCVGHTYGNKECYGRSLQTYGCNSFGSKPTQAELDVLPKEETPTLSYGKRCEVKSVQTVQCCGDTDCGSNAFCDKVSWTCKSTAECTQDTDCGVSITCDRVKKELKKPVCSSGKCSYKVLQNVECCFNEDCPDDSICNADKKCEKKVIVKTDCPFSCCYNEPYYFDKPCVAGQVCCGEHVCAVNENSCSIPPGITDKVKCELAGGKWFEVKEEPPFWKFWASDKIVSYCRIPHTPVLAVVLLIVGGVGAIASGFFGLIPITYVSGLIAVISLVWLLLARSGIL